MTPPVSDADAEFSGSHPTWCDPMLCESFWHGEVLHRSDPEILHLSEEDDAAVMLRRQQVGPASDGNDEPVYELSVFHTAHPGAWEPLLLSQGDVEALFAAFQRLRELG
jgi:hypothetical protein